MSPAPASQDRPSNASATPGLDDPTVHVAWEPEAPHVAVIQPRNDRSLAILHAYLTRHRAAVEAMLHRARGAERGGAVVLRGWDISDAARAEEIVHDVLEIPPLTPFGETLTLFGDFNARAARLGVPPDGVVQRERSRTVPAAKEGRMQPPHTEFGLGPHRPRVGAFFCEVAPTDPSLGTTALCDLGDTLDALTDADRALLESHGWWSPRAGVPQPWTLTHPESGRRVLGHLYCLTNTLSRKAFRAYRAVRARRPAYPEVVAMDDAGNDQGIDHGLQVVDAQGRPADLGGEPTHRLLQAAFEHTSFFQWQTHDLLLFDNLLFAHWRMPGGNDRRLHAFFGDEVDVRRFTPDDAPEVVRRAVSTPCAGGNALVLGTLGLGGKPWALRWLMLLPDALFAWLGRWTWGRRDHSGAEARAAHRGRR